jgi:hypothetical protein
MRNTMAMAKSKTKTRTAKTSRATSATNTPAPAPASEERWNRLVARQPAALTEPGPADRPVEAPERAQLPQDGVPGAEKGATYQVERPPLRPETKDEERARYPARMNAWEAAKAVVEGRKGREAEDASHRTTCVARRCDDPAHCLPRREWREVTRHDLRHLGSCPAEVIEACPADDASHLLPPRPLEVAEEYCCWRRCYPRTDVRSLTECISLAAPLRRRRQRELKAFGRPSGFRGGVAGAAAVTTNFLGDAWGFNRKTYDPATVPPRGRSEQPERVGSLQSKRPFGGV